MTYWQFLVVFLLVPITGLGAMVAHDRLVRRLNSHRQDRQRRGWAPFILLVGLIAVAMVYTSPWDNYLIAQGVWRYSPSLVSGLRLGWIPVEEVAFFALQTILIWLWVQWLNPRVMAHGGDADEASRKTRDMSPDIVARTSAIQSAGAQDGGCSWVLSRTTIHGERTCAGRWISIVVGTSGWVASLIILSRGWPPGTYLGWELVWALPPLILQVGLGGEFLWRSRPLLVRALVPAVLYLSLVDAVAIHQGIWVISLHRSLGLLLGGVLPVEEFIFFLVTSTLVTCGIILGEAPKLRQRISWIGGTA